MFITQKHLSRRTVLKGIGVTMGLPLLEAMAPVKAFGATTGRKIRLVCVEMVTAPPAARRMASRKTCGRRPASDATST